jgi:hypothetical protein
VWKPEAAMTTGVGGLLPLTNSYTPKGSPVGAALTDARAAADIGGLAMAITATGPTVIMVMGVAGATKMGQSTEAKPRPPDPIAG